MTKRCAKEWKGMIGMQSKLRWRGYDGDED